MDWGQLRTIIWLRWRLSRNQWSRGGWLNAVLTILVAVFLLLLGIAGGIAGVLVGALVLAEMSPERLLFAWDVFVGLFLIAWMIGLVSEIQRSETIDISRLLHFPISLRDVFLINYVVSHLTPSIILFVPWTLGLTLGLVLGRSGSMAWMFPLVLSFIFMITAWTYCLRGWLVTLMVNKRRRRAIIAGITFAFILLSQLPYILGHLAHDRDRHGPGTTVPSQTEQQTTARPESRDRPAIPRGVFFAHKVVPLLWVGNGAMSLATGSAWPAVLGAAGAFGIGGLGIRRAYRSTVRFYQGQVTAKRSAPKPKAEKIRVARRNLLEKQLPRVPEEAAALALAFFRCLSRAPEVKMALATNFIMLLVFAAMIFFKRGVSVGEGFEPIVATGAVLFMFLGMSQLMFNQFGFDRAGFRTLALSPAPRKHILLGKNLAFLPIVLAIGFTLLVFVKIALGISLTAALAAGLQLLSAFFLVSIVGNLLSVHLPCRVAPGSLKAAKTSTKTSLLIFVSRMLFPTAMIPVFLPPVFGLLLSKLLQLPAAPINLLLSAVVLLLLAISYRLSLAPLGELLQQREKRILEVVTHEVE